MEGTRTTQEGHSANLIVIHPSSQENHTMSIGSESKEEFSSVQSKDEDNPVNLS
jgi:hypothetical protein